MSISKHSSQGNNPSSLTCGDHFPISITSLDGIFDDLYTPEVTNAKEIMYVGQNAGEERPMAAAEGHFLQMDNAVIENGYVLDGLKEGILNQDFPALGGGNSLGIEDYPLQQIASENVPVENIDVPGSQAYFIPPGTEQLGLIDTPITNVSDGGSMSVPNGSQSFNYIHKSVEFAVDGVLTSRQKATPQDELHFLKDGLQVVTGEQYGTDLAIIDVDGEELAKNIFHHHPSSFNEDDVSSIEIGLFDEVCNQMTTIDEEAIPSTTSSPPATPTPSNTNRRRRRKDRPSANKPTLEDQSESKKLKKWSIKESFEDKKLEKQRKDAIRAKKNREKNKNQVVLLQEKLNEAIKEREDLKIKVSELKKKEDLMEKRLKECQCSLANGSTLGQTSVTSGDTQYLLVIPVTAKLSNPSFL